MAKTAKAPKAAKTPKTKTPAKPAEPKIRRGAACGRLPKDIDTTQVLTRWPVEEYDAVRETAKKEGLNIGTFIRESAKAAVEGKTFKPAPFKKALVSAATAEA